MTHQKNFKRAVRAFADSHNLSYTDALILLNAAKSEFELENSTGQASVESDQWVIEEVETEKPPHLLEQLGLTPGHPALNDAGLHIYGRAGSGKTSLLCEVGGKASNLGWQVRVCSSNKAAFMAGVHTGTSSMPYDPRFIEPEDLYSFLWEELSVRDEQDAEDPIVVLIDEVPIWTNAIFQSDHNVLALGKNSAKRGLHIVMATHGQELTPHGLSQYFHRVRAGRALREGERVFVANQETASKGGRFGEPGVMPKLSWNILPLGKGFSELHQDIITAPHLLVSDSDEAGSLDLLAIIKDHCAADDTWEVRESYKTTLRPLKDQALKSKKNSLFDTWIDDAVEELRRREALMAEQSVGFFMQLREEFKPQLYIVHAGPFDSAFTQTGESEAVGKLQLLTARGHDAGIYIVLVGNSLAQDRSLHKLVSNFSTRVVFRGDDSEDSLIHRLDRRLTTPVSKLPNGHFLTTLYGGAREGAVYHSARSDQLPAQISV